MKNFFILLSFSITISFIFSCTEQKGDYICPPCNLPCDTLSFSESGICPHCQMKLMKKEDLIVEELVFNKVDIERGSGVFLIEGGVGNKEKHLKIYYHKPQNFTPNSKILLVIPGAGRNADSYRDTWIEASEKHSILILSPMYSEADYDYGAYHLSNLVYDLNLEECVTFVENSNHVILDEDKFSFKVNPNKDEWIFNDFDRIFDLVVNELNSTQTKYDIFGHSAGGQILHRLAIFYPESKAKRIIASNSGSYTLPDFTNNLPFGIKNTDLSEENIKQSFEKKLVIFIGELDNEHETGGRLLRSPTVDQQGLGRLERGKYFFEKSKLSAEKIGANFNWELKIIPNIGHNQKKMGHAAAQYLYEGE